MYIYITKRRRQLAVMKRMIADELNDTAPEMSRPAVVVGRTEGGDGEGEVGGDEGAAEEGGGEEGLLEGAGVVEAGGGVVDDGVVVGGVLVGGSVLGRGGAVAVQEAASPQRDLCVTR